ncbi:MAG: 50S ribosomal protein L9 [Armatimonadetes bacterium]|nr:50S ribosomal protein L9 [Armatimonadota bacterium]
MRVILVREVKSLGKPDDIVNVSEGYARNFLFPRHLAVPAEGGHMTELNRRRRTEEQKGEKLAEDAKSLAEKIEGKQVTIKGKVGQGTKLYGAVTPADIAEAIQNDLGAKVDKRKIDSHEPIKSVGTHDIRIHLHRDVTVGMTVEVVGE